MRIAIVNDTRLAVEALRRTVSSRGHQVAWVAPDGSVAVENCARDTPDLVLMDLIMPVMDGVEATRRIMAASPCAILVVTSSVEANQSAVFNALGLGALDAVATPSFGAEEALLQKIDTIGRLLHYRNKSVILKDRSAANGVSKGRPLVVVGSSAGGPRALATLLAGLPADFDAGLAIVQHLDADFAGSLAAWLTQESKLPVRIATAGVAPSPGTAWLAGTGQNMLMTAEGRLTYQTEPGTSPYHPCVDVFFESVAQHWTGSVVAVVLTGMGRDGAVGLLKLRERGHHTIAQDEATSAVYGMPRAARESGAAVETLPLGDIAAALVHRVTRR